VNPRLPASIVGDDTIVGFIPMQAVADGATGEYKVIPRPLREVSKGHTAFINGDILWAKITPCMQNGKSCLVSGLPNGVGFGSTEFHVLRIRSPGVSGRFVREFLSSASLRRVATYAFAGSAGQQRVPASFLESLPFPELPEELQNEVSDNLAAVRSEARRLRADAQAEWEGAKEWFEVQVLGADLP
jgi:type I restriction enzyme S subunit